jgi:hypothetical protein
MKFRVCIENGSGGNNTHNPGYRCTGDTAGESTGIGPLSSRSLIIEIDVINAAS